MTNDASSARDRREPATREPGAEGTRPAETRVPPALSEEQIDAMLANAIGFDGGLQQVNRDDLCSVVRASLQASPGVAPAEATTDEVLELTVILEQKRALHIAEVVKSLAPDDDMPKPYWSGWWHACEEIAHRLEHEKWELSVEGGWAPVGGHPASNAQLATPGAPGTAAAPAEVPHFNIVHAICRFALHSPTEVLIHQIERLVRELSGRQQQSLLALIHKAKNQEPQRPVTPLVPATTTAAAQPIAWVDETTMAEMRDNPHGALALHRWLAVGGPDHFKGRSLPLYAAPPADTAAAPPADTAAARDDWRIPVELPDGRICKMRKCDLIGTDLVAFIDGDTLPPHGGAAARDVLAEHASDSRRFRRLLDWWFSGEGPDLRQALSPDELIEALDEKLDRATTPKDWTDPSTGEQRVTPRPAPHKRPPPMATPKEPKL
jgi:hypothetical protein